jgi:hypothetical protein
MDARKTSILASFAPTSNVTTEQYDETIRRLEKSGDWLPEGLEYHVAFQVRWQVPSQRDLGLARAVRRVRRASDAGAEGRWDRAG